MEAGAKAKYLNSPETALFHKGALLFNHHRARKAAHEAGEIIAVEGYIDAITASEAGFPTSSRRWAPRSPPISARSCGRWRASRSCASTATMPDERPLSAPSRLALPLIGAGKSLRFALLPEGQDPDDLIRVSGPAAMAEHLKGARPFADMLFIRETDGQRFDTPEQRAALEQRLGDAVARIGESPCADITRRT